MAYGTPADPVGGTVITVSYAVSNILDPLRWIRLLTGNADPPGTAYIVASTSTSGTQWQKVTNDLIADGVIDARTIAAGAVVAHLGYTPANRAGDTFSAQTNFFTNAAVAAVNVWNQQAGSNGIGLSIINAAFSGFDVLVTHAAATFGVAISGTSAAFSGAVAAASATLSGALSAASASISGALGAGSVSAGSVAADSVSVAGVGTALSVAHDASIGGGLGVTGNAAFSNGVTIGGAGTGLSVTHDETVGGSFAVTGGATFGGAVAAASAAFVAAVTAASATIAGLLSAGSAAISGNATVGGTLGVAGTSTLGAVNSGAVTSSAAVQGTRLVSTVASPTAPISVASGNTTLVPDLHADNSDKLGTVAASSYARKDAASDFTTAPTINSAAVDRALGGSYTGFGAGINANFDVSVPHFNPTLTVIRGSNGSLHVLVQTGEAIGLVVGVGLVISTGTHNGTAKFTVDFANNGPNVNGVTYTWEARG
jgi:hypothetical protein